MYFQPHKKSLGDSINRIETRIECFLGTNDGFLGKIETLNLKSLLTGVPLYLTPLSSRRFFAKLARVIQ